MDVSVAQVPVSILTIVPKILADQGCLALALTMAANVCSTTTKKATRLNLETKLRAYLTSSDIIAENGSVLKVCMFIVELHTKIYHVKCFF